MTRSGKARRYCKRTYKKLNMIELEEYRNKNTIKIKNMSKDTKVAGGEEFNSCYKKAGNEGKKHSDKKIEIGLELFKKFKDQFKDNEEDGIWFEYPLISLDNKSKFSKYNQKKLSYLLSLFQPILIENSLNSKVKNNIEDVIIKNLHNIFNPNLKSSLRGRKSLKALSIEKVVDIAVVCNGKIVKIIEVNISNKLTKSQTDLINKLYPETLEEI
jgi:hypothetical protein